MHKVNARTAYLSWRCVNSLQTVEEMRTSVTLSACQHPVRRFKLVPRAAAKEIVQNNGTSLGVLHFKSPSLSGLQRLLVLGCFPHSRSDEMLTLDRQLKEELTYDSRLLPRIVRIHKKRKHFRSFFPLKLKRLLPLRCETLQDLNMDSLHANVCAFFSFFPF